MIEQSKKHYISRIFWVIFSIIFMGTNVKIVSCANSNVKFVQEIAYENDTGLNYKLAMEQKSQVSGLTVKITYDSKQLDLDDNSVGEVLNNCMVKVNSQKEGIVILTAVSMEPISEMGEILCLKFNVIDESNSYLSVNCSIEECINLDCEELRYSINSLKIKNPLFKNEEKDQETEIKGEKDIKKEKRENAEIEVEQAKENNKEQNTIKQNRKEKDHETEKKEIGETKGAVAKGGNRYLYLSLLLVGMAIVITVKIFIKRRKGK